MAEPNMEQLAEQVRGLKSKVDSLEMWRNEQRTDTAVRAERDRHMDQRFDRVESSINEVKGYLLRIVWVIMIGIIGAVITFMVSGGFMNVPTP